jgi:molybdopterin-containing oxidoreductase family membrane subunit
MTAASITPSRNKPGLWAWLGITGLLALLGVAAWVLQLQQGVGVTALSNLNAWGVYIAGFIFFMGLSAGSLVLAALPVLFDLPKLRPYARLSAFVALIALVVGGLFILVDIGRPERLWRIVRFAQLGSPMLWDMLLTVAYLVIATVLLRRLLTAKSDAEVKPIAWVALLAGVADGLTAFVFATQVGREFWFSAVQPVAFFVAALASAGALLLLLVALFERAGAAPLGEVAPLPGLTAATLALGLLLAASEVITLAFSRRADGLTLVTVMLQSPLFWAEVVTGLLAIALLLLPATRRSPLWLALAAALALISLAAKRLLFVYMGFAVQNINYAGVAIAPAGPYVPGLVEMAVVVGLAALFGFALALGLNNLRLVEAER